MNTESVRILRWFWAWQDEKEEAWLSEKAREGLHLESISLPGIYTFRRGEPGEYVYRLDFQSLKRGERDSYLQLFEDAGWEHIGDLGSWVYFRHQETGDEIPEIFSDRESKIGKYHRLLAYLAIFLPMMIFLVLENNLVERYGGLMIIVEILQVALVLIFFYAVIQLLRRINQLKDGSKTY